MKSNRLPSSDCRNKDSRLNFGKAYRSTLRRAPKIYNCFQRTATLPVFRTLYERRGHRHLPDLKMAGESEKTSICMALVPAKPHDSAVVSCLPTFCVSNET